MKLLFSSSIAPEVGFLKSLLDEAKVPCELRNEAVQSILPGAPFQPEIWVINDDDYAKATQVRDTWRMSTGLDPSQGLFELPTQRTRAASITCGLGALVFLCMAVALGRSSAHTADQAYLLAMVICLLIMFFFVWLASMHWNDTKIKSQQRGHKQPDEGTR